MGRPRSAKGEQRLLVDQLRREGATWPVVATAIRDRWGVNMRVAFRLAHGWSQGDAAVAWNARWPDEPKTHKSFSTWELWPGPNGHAPSLPVLDRLAELYECGVADLLADAGGYGHLDVAQRGRAQLAAQLPGLLQVTATVAHPEDAGSVPGAAGAQPADQLTEWIRWLDEMSFGELTDKVQQVTAHVGDPVTRRSVFGKLAAALSLAAASAPVLGALPANAEDGTPASRPGDPSGGIWLSRYRYYSDGRAAEFSGQHYAVLRRSGNRLSGKSLPTLSGSTLELDLTVGGPVVTGTWTERTSPDGYYGGATYHGALQLIANPTGRSMAGMWVGYTKEFKINSGPWELTWTDRTTAARQYHQKV
jgi:hypothetical protein